MNRVKLTLVAAALAAPVIATTLAGAAGNLVPNGDFSQGTTGWTPNDQQTQLAVTPGGRLEVANISGNPGISVDSASQCVTGINDLYLYGLSSNVFIPAGQSRVGLAQVYLTPWMGPNCDGAYGGFGASTEEVSAIGVVQTRSATLVPSPGVKSVRVFLRAQTINAGQGQDPNGFYRVEFDNVWVEQGPLKPQPPQQPEPPQPVAPDPEPVAPDIPQGPFDIVILGPLGGAPDPVKPSGPSTPEQPSQPQTPAQPSQPVEPKADTPQAEAPEADAPVAHADAPASDAAGSAPLPPSTGTGIASTDRSMPLVAMATALVAIAGATFAFATRHSR